MWHLTHLHLLWDSQNPVILTTTISLEIMSLFLAFPALVHIYTYGSSPVAQQVKDPTLSLQWLRSKLWCRFKSLAWEFLHAMGRPKKTNKNAPKELHNREVSGNMQPFCELLRLEHPFL